MKGAEHAGCLNGFILFHSGYAVERGLDRGLLFNLEKLRLIGRFVRRGEKMLSSPLKAEAAVLMTF